MATYVNNLRLKEITTGDEDGTWGASTNVNLELIADALGYDTEDGFATDADATLTVADGITDPARALYLKITSSATLTTTRTLTIAPNTVSRVMFIENATTGSQSIAISQGSGGNVTIPNGSSKLVYLDGAGSTAAVVDITTNLSLAATPGSFTDLTATGTVNFTGATVSDLGSVTTADINGGTVDGVTIGGASAGAGTFTTVDINGGTVDGVTIGGASAGAGTFTTLADQYGSSRILPSIGAAKSGSYTLEVGDVGQYVSLTTGGSITIPDATFADGDLITLLNETSGTITITCSITTAYIAGSNTDESTATIDIRGVCNVLFISGTICYLTGNVY